MLERKDDLSEKLIFKITFKKLLYINILKEFLNKKFAAAVS
jgi:hypothetical protein